MLLCSLFVVATGVERWQYFRRMDAGRSFAADFAALHGCTAIRIGTWLHNGPAKRLYQRNRFRIAGEGRIRLQGLIDEEQVYLERKIQ